MKSQRKRPSPALIVAVAAMAFALVGTAVAAHDGPAFPKLSKSKVKRIAKKQAIKQLEEKGQLKGLTKFTAITTFENGWRSYGTSTFSPPGYWVSEDGIVNLQGALAGGTNSAAFTLPDAVRPQTYRDYAIRCNSGDYTGLVEISPSTGEVSIVSPGAVRCDIYASLDGITYRPDN